MYKFMNKDKQNYLKLLKNSIYNRLLQYKTSKKLKETK